MADDKEARPRRLNVTYTINSPRKATPTRGTVLSARRKNWISEYRGTHKEDIGSEAWIKGLTAYLAEKDATIVADDVDRWTKKYEWVISKEEDGYSLRDKKNGSNHEGRDGDATSAA